ncbi:MAG TPA: response regulator [Rhodopila sp.]|nr:response regulator [Rhodopila sp.]
MTVAEDTILVVDDNPAGLYLKTHILRGAGFTVAGAPTAQIAIAHCRADPPAVALLDVWLPDMHGVELCRRLKAEFPGLVVLQTSAAATSAHDRALALEGGADSFMIEPIEPEELRAVTRSLLRMRNAEQALRRLNDTLEQTVAERTYELQQANTQLEIEVAERRKAEDALWHAQKLEAIGQLTGGIAHDFNNLLAVIVGGLEMVRGALDSDEELPRAKLIRLVTAAQTAADRGAKLTNQLLAFARRTPLRSEIARLSEMFAASEPLFRRALGETVALDISLQDGLWPCQLDPTQFEAAILNLLVNARDAMPQGGKVEITAENMMSPPPGIAWLNDEAPGPCICIRVSDNGPGMSPDVMAHVFEPFFTTKEVGKGTGLGLSQVYGFVRQSGGNIALDSSLGGGTTFRLYLPRADEEASALASVHPALEALQRGSETILIVEDNDEVREMAVALLHELGYQVLTAPDAPAALGVLDENRIDLLFSDVVMPGGMTGYDLVRRARGLKQGLKALLTSGYTHRGAADPDAAVVPLLQKPYKRAELAVRVRSILDNP